MNETIERLAASHGIQTRYISELGEAREIDEGAARALLQALKVDPEGGPVGGFHEAQQEPRLSCLLSDSDRDTRLWGISVQLYALRSDRNLGIGDFEDLATLAEIGAAEGAAFIGVNPLHALFFADPGRFGPYSPSTRRFINPFYLAVDKLPGGAEAVDRLRAAEPALIDPLKGELVDYLAMGRVKQRLLREVFTGICEGLDNDEDFRAFLERGGDTLRDFALFETISAHMGAQEGGSHGWHNWPEEFHKRGGEAVKAFESAHEDEIRFHQWLQFAADRQLADAQARAKTAGMRIGLYLDFAVGVSPDGAETWADPDLTVRAARIGSPPDMFNSAGQDWGLAPLSPGALAERDYRPLADAYQAMMAHAGAVRIDHAMGLARLWWIPEGSHSSDGGYVRYPLGAMVDTVARMSRENRCLVIGEDLGTVPEGFRPTMEEAGILSYRVLYFERNLGGTFYAPESYPALSLACVSTHDLATLAGWWDGADIRLRSEMGRQSTEHTERDLASRKGDRKALIEALDREALLGPERSDLLAGEPPSQLSGDLAIAVHRYGARARSMLFAVQLEDMILSRKQPNLPGTTDEYPNWRIRSDIRLEDLASDNRFKTMAHALRAERPEHS